MPYDLRIDRQVVKQVARFDPKIFRQVVVRILELGENPRPHDCQELKGYRDPTVPGRKGYRIDEGEYRILFTIDDARRAVTVFRVGHRSDVYRQG
jgi:mRNA interferase RelE/StbE